MKTAALQKYVTNKKDTKEQIESPGIEDSMDEETITNMVPISKFKSNHLSKKEKEIKNAAILANDL